MKIDLWKVAASATIIVFVTVIGMIAYAHFVLDRMDRSLERASSRLSSTVSVQQQAAEQRKKAKELAQAEMRRRQTEQRRYRLKKERAWQTNYQLPENCQTYRDGQHLVECVNHRMRAKREFEAKYPKYAPR